MKGVSLLSGGKDSFISTILAMSQGVDVNLCLTVVPEEDSMMFHVPNVHLADKVASLLGIGTELVSESGYLDRLRELKLRGFDGVVCGAIASEYQKTRIEKVCTDLGMVCIAPLWMKDQFLIMREIIESGIRAIIVSVSAEGLGEEILGRTIDDYLLEHLLSIRDSIGINITGEGGEYESLVTGMNFKERIRLKGWKKIWNGSSGYLRIESVEMV